MTLPLTVETLEACYEYLRTTPPFSKWKMPPGHEVKFTVGRARDCFAYYQWDGNRHTITVSENSVAHTITLINAMAHECIHLHQFRQGLNTSNTEHNADWHARATKVCRLHGWDRKTF